MKKQLNIRLDEYIIRQVREAVEKSGGKYASMRQFIELAIKEKIGRELK